MSDSKIYSIGLISSLTGVKEATLRKWESRYGYPDPERSDSGRRYYSQTHLSNLISIKEQVDTGIPIRKAIKNLKNNILPGQVTDDRSFNGIKAYGMALEALKAHDLELCKSELRKILNKGDLIECVEQILAPMMVEVGECWYRGEISPYQEHCISSLLELALIEATMKKRVTRRGKNILLTTPYGELHTLGLSLLEIVLASIGGRCLNIGGGLSFQEVCKAVHAYSIEIVCISVSLYCKPRITHQYLAELRASLPKQVALWVGGQGINLMKSLPAGVTYCATVGEAADIYSSLPRYNRPPVK
ncbi:MAG: cobalamin B12-binding domain-containing protein [Candidatus Thiodiazotropha sp. (ex. Lucinisca nassula)]|nr:cobalamin B12-binding domain-containing protein [Candidatus Thiodiazotropha sp. (ex. Lucinisca nassula)]